MAIAIGCGLPSEKGLVTSVVAGFLISAPGGSRFQVGGPAAAFIVVVAGIVEKHGIGALMTARFCAVLILIVAGLMKLAPVSDTFPGPLRSGSAAELAC